MNIEFDNNVTNEVEQSEKTGNQNSVWKQIKFFLLLLICFIFAFSIWCYASYIDDPIMQKDVVVHFDFDGNGSLIATPSKIRVYGEESKLASLYEIKVLIDSDSFANGNKITVEVDLPDGVYSHDNTIEVELRKYTK